MWVFLINEYVIERRIFCVLRKVGLLLSKGRIYRNIKAKLQVLLRTFFSTFSYLCGCIPSCFSLVKEGIMQEEFASFTLHYFYLFLIKTSFCVLQNDSITESTLTWYFALILDLNDPFEQDILFNLTFQLECFLLSFFFF